MKLASKELLSKLRANKNDVIVEDSHKHQRIQVERFIKNQLHGQLKEIYNKATFREKSDEVFIYLFYRRSAKWN